ncbi:CDP-alcohol phosphatidyltransferase family protein [Actinopolymorpha alba]|uniref:CDP-alcohol phosphatidyltransferase family protein n=1 Tax=Actinopolymorpha alba TaxID=533267 RepID=UPI00036023EF|nr:CDP-alcohol phosphatidyltransferase family protein [Actinopolymorpha alba]
MTTLPSIAELRAKAHPPGLLDRRSGEHWAGRMYMRRISLYATRLFLVLRLSPNQLTGLMIVAGVGAGFALLWPGLPGAILAALLVQIYLLLDCSDGEVARWTGRTSMTGIYLDRVGHYLCEAALLVGLGFRAAGGQPTGYAVLGLAAALGAILIKAETDLVDVARSRHGLTAVTEEAVEPRAAGLARLRRVALVLRFYRIILAIELSLIIVVAAVIDTVRGDLLATHVLTVAVAVVAGVQVVLHLVSILVSRRLA